jgi:hypothetical protein
LWNDVLLVFLLLFTGLDTSLTNVSVMATAKYGPMLQLMAAAFVEIHHFLVLLVGVGDPDLLKVLKII